MNIQPSVAVASRDLESYVQKKVAPKLTDSEKAEILTHLEYTIVLYVEERHKVNQPLPSPVHSKEKKQSSRFFNLKVFMNLQTLEIEKNQKNTNNCSKTYFEVYDGTTSLENRRYQACSTQNNKFLKSDSNALFVRFKLKENITSNNNYFNLVFNSFRSGKLRSMNPCWPVDLELERFSFQDSCSNSSFRCADGSCIEKRLRCDGIQNCVNNDDEGSCSKPSIINSMKPMKFGKSSSTTLTIRLLTRSS